MRVSVLPILGSAAGAVGACSLYSRWRIYRCLMLGPRRVSPEDASTSPRCNGSGGLKFETRDFLPAPRDCVAAHRQQIGGLPQEFLARDAALIRSIDLTGDTLFQNFDGVGHWAPPCFPKGRECARSSLIDGNALVSRPSAPEIVLTMKNPTPVRRSGSSEMRTGAQLSAVSPIAKFVVFEVVPGSPDAPMRSALVSFFGERPAGGDPRLDIHRHPLKTTSGIRLARGRWLATVRIRLGVPSGGSRSVVMANAER